MTRPDKTRRTREQNCIKRKPDKKKSASIRDSLFATSNRPARAKARGLGLVYARPSYHRSQLLSHYIGSRPI